MPLLVGPIFLMPQSAAALTSRPALIVSTPSCAEPGVSQARADAAVLSAALKEADYEVVERIDAGKAEIERALSDFRRRSAYAGGMLYVTGPVETRGGKDYLVTADGGANGIAIEALLDMATGGSTAGHVIVIDAHACPPDLSGQASQIIGPAAPDRLPQQVLLAYSARPGSRTADMAGGVSLYADALASVLRVQGLNADEVFRLVRVIVATRTKDAQTPWEQSSLSTMFTPGVAVDRGEMTVSLQNAAIGPLSAGIPGRRRALAEPFSYGMRNDLPWIGWSDEVGADIAARKRDRDLRASDEESASSLASPLDFGGLAPTGRATSRYQDIVEHYSLARPSNAPFMPELDLGRMFAEGRGVARDYAEARRWYLKAAQKGNVIAMYNLGLLYRGVDGVPKDSAKAIQWLRAAADKGVPAAIGELGVLYGAGDGLAKDSVQAMHLYRQAAELGDVNAMYNLAVGYALGDGAPKNCIEARDWLSRANEGGHREAGQELQNGIGQCQWW